jgi:hypothetical protein
MDSVMTLRARCVVASGGRVLKHPAAAHKSCACSRILSKAPPWRPGVRIAPGSAILKCSSRIGGCVNARSCDPRRRGCGLFQHTRCFDRWENPTGTDRTSEPSHFNCHELHDVVQLTGGELPNDLPHSGAADAHDGNALWVHNLQRDGESGMHNILQFVAACVSDKLRPAITVAIILRPQRHNIRSGFPVKAIIRPSVHQPASLLE